MIDADFPGDTDDRRVALDGDGAVEMCAEVADVAVLMVDEVVARTERGEVRIGRLSGSGARSEKQQRSDERQDSSFHQALLERGLSRCRRITNGTNFRES